MILKEEFFGNVPKHQYLMLKNFIEEHPYKKYVNNDTYQYYQTLKSIYKNNVSYVFEEPGGHHMLFLYPEEYIQVMKDLIEW